VVRYGDNLRVDEVQIKKDKKKSNFKSYKVISIHFEDSTVLETIKYEGRFQFAKVIRKGTYLTWYTYIDSESNNINNGANLLVKQSGEQSTYSGIGFKKRVSEFLESCQSVSIKINKGAYGLSKMAQIVDDYNACITEQEGKRNSTLDQAISIEEELPLNALILSVKESSLESKEDLVVMLEDANSKLGRGEPIPSYLKELIISKFGMEKGFVDQFIGACED